MTRFLLITAVLFACGTGFAGDPQGGDGSGTTDLTLYPRVKMETTLGDFVLELNGEKAPITAMNFIWYVEDGYYDGTIFHRVVKDKLIQGGAYLPNLDRKLEGLRPGIPNEWNNGLKNEQWTIAMTRRRERHNAATSGFQINMRDIPRFDIPNDGAAIAVFGKVVEGIETIADIRDTETTMNPRYGGTATTIPAEPVIIKSAKVINTFDRAKLEAIANEAIGTLRGEREARKEQNARELADLINNLEDEARAKLVTTDSGLMYVDLKIGLGPSPKPRDTVKAHYTGWLADGREFQSTRHNNEPKTFKLIETVPAWIEGLQTMRVGGKRKLIAPPELGYGPLGRPGLIPPHAVLVFEIELLGIEKDEEEASQTGKDE